MASTLKVQNIAHTGGTNALAIDSAGTVDFPVNNNVSIFGLTSSVTINSSSLSTLTGWSVINSQNSHGFKTLGSTVNESSGFFTPTKLGLYRIDADFNMYNNSSSSGVRWIEIDLAFTPNGQSEIGGDVYNNFGYLQSDTTYGLANRTRFYNFNHANDKVRIRVASSAAILLQGNGASNFDTQIMFTWLSPPVA
mgnify:CR=1 FL=1|tara:strand:+ start:1641 stop:2222 length:582 start_codon:yes stop_codon:yes gene_type:complete